MCHKLIYYRIKTLTASLCPDLQKQRIEAEGRLTLPITRLPI